MLSFWFSQSLRMKNDPKMTLLRCITCVRIIWSLDATLSDFYWLKISFCGFKTWKIRKLCPFSVIFMNFQNAIRVHGNYFFRQRGFNKVTRVIQNGGLFVNEHNSSIPLPTHTSGTTFPDHYLEFWTNRVIQRWSWLMKFTW